jgi:hypothetical protein
MNDVDVGYVLPGLESPAGNAAAITPGSSPLAEVTRALYIGGAGNVTVTMKGGQSVTFTALPAGAILPIRATHVTAATASAIIGLW